MEKTFNQLTVYQITGKTQLHSAYSPIPAFYEEIENKDNVGK